MIKNVFFDFDGVIINSERSIVEGLKYALSNTGYDIPEYSVLKECIGPPFKISMPNILKIKEEDYDEFLTTYRGIYDTKTMYYCELYDGIEDCLKDLNNRGYSLTICSSKNERACRAIAKHLNIEKYFVDIVGSTPESNIELKSEVINHAFERSPWQNRLETVIVGDTKYDAKGAVEAGITCIGVSYGFGTIDELISNGAVAVLDSPKEVARYIEER
ncbi:MAG: HAD hydrolase-like protein [Pseudobutyrivibrio sp.]|nr:HAD hydrolase-like protein [Pseudobutyrivibrio sp.]